MNFSFKRSFKIFPAIAGILVGISNVIFFFTKSLSVDNWGLYIGISNVVLAFFASVLILYTAYFSSDKLSAKSTYWGLFAAIGLFFIAEIVWSFANTDAYPSVADFIWVLGTVVLIAELIRHRNASKAKISLTYWSIFAVIITTIVTILVIFVFWDVLLSPYDVAESYGPVQKSFDIFYFTADVLLIFAVGVIFLDAIELSGWRDDIGWFILLGGMIAMVVGDSFYTALSATRDYKIEDLFYTLQYVLWGIGIAWFPMDTFSEKRKKSKKQEDKK